MSILWILFASLLVLYDTSLSSAAKSCGRSPRIGNGFFHAYPWLAQVEFERVKDPGVKKIACLGSLVNTRFVLTTAVCAQGSPRYNLVGIKLGGYSSDEDDTIQVGIKKAIVHPDYRTSDLNQNNDIALFELDRKVELTDTIRPVCLPSGEELSGTHLTAATWGLNLHSGKQTALHTVDLPVVGKKQCATVYQTAKREIGDGVICAGGEAGKDTCRGDTGGPLMDLKTQTVVGIVSYGPFTCGKEGWPSVYTNVIKYLPWINETINK